MKRLLAALLVFALSITSLAACSNSGNSGDTRSTSNTTNEAASNTTNEAASNTASVTANEPESNSSTETAAEEQAEAPHEDISGDLYVWLDNEDWADVLIAAFMEKYPNVTVDFEIVGSTDQREMMTLDGPAGNGPDVFIQPHDGIALAINDGIVEPIPADMQARLSGQILDPALNTVTYDGTLYGVPFQTENIAFFYNKDLVDKAPTSFEEVLEFAKEYHDPANNQYALRWQVNDAYHNYLFLSGFGFSIFGPNMDDYRQAPFDSPEVAKGLAFQNQFRDYFDFSTEDISWDSTVAAFQRGEVPFTITGPWAIADAVSNNTNFGITKIPTINGVQPRVFSGATIAHVSSFSNNMPAAFAFVEFMGTADGAKILYDVKGTLTALEDISAIPGLKDDVYLKGIQEQSPYADPMPTIPEVALMWEPLADLFTFTWNRQLTIEETQQRAMDTYSMLLQATGKSLDD